MATINKLSKLFGALADHNLDRAGQIAADIVQDEERKGHYGSARLLRGSLANGSNGKAQCHESLLRTGFPRVLADALSTQTPASGLQEVSLRASMRSELETVIKEWRNAQKLTQAGIRRRSRLFFHGPPGCGKSLTAKSLGFELCLPTYIVRFDAVIGAYLGQTAIHLRELFRFAETHPSVLVFDEVDALGKQRGSPLDVGELDRIVIAFLQELEHAAPAGLVVATSNLPGQLDRALWRRFDLVMEFPAPNRKEIGSFAAELAKRHELPLKRIRAEVARAKSYAEAEQLVEARVRKRLLAECQHKNAARPKKR